MSLSEFLLARISEREAHLNRLVEDEDGLVWVGTHSGNGPYFGVGLRSLLAECEAKRQIVEEHAPGQYRNGAMRYECFRCVGVWGAANCPTQRYLASVYADHPDYREEWKP